MKKSIQASIRIKIHQRRSAAKMTDLLSAFFCSCLMTMGVALLMRGTFNSLAKVSLGATLAVGAAFCLLLLLAEQLGFHAWVLPVGCIFLTVLVLILRSDMQGGACALINDAQHFLTKETATIYLELEQAQSVFAPHAATVLLALTALLLSSAAYGGTVLPALPIILPVLIGLGARWLRDDFGTASFLFGMLILVCLRCPSGKGRLGLSSFFGVLLCLLLSLSIGTALGVAAGQRDVSGVKNSLEDAIRTLRYGGEQSSMPRGKLEKLGAWKPGSQAALAVTLEKPSKLYLRGMTGEQYSGNAWTALESESLAEYEALFYWRHKNGHYAQTGIAEGAALIDETPTLSLTVEVLSADREWAYIPYALSGTELLDPQRIGDRGAVALENNYSLEYLPGSVPEWFSLQSAIMVEQRRDEVQTYLAQEQAYRQFVEENYLGITEEAVNVLDRALELETDGRTLSQIKDIILNYLEENMVYDTQVSTDTGNGEFLRSFFEQTGRGYSVHYATAAALMLRYFGVPSRYVEGYFIPMEKAESMKAAERTELTEQYAHAWAEYYLDGVGWIPFETTPGYRDDEELNAGPGSGLEGERIFKQKEQSFAGVKQPDTIREVGGLRNAFHVPKFVWLLLLILFAVILLLSIWVRRMRLKKRIEALQREEPRNAITGLYGYGRMLLSLVPGTQVPITEESMHRLNLEAMFSMHVMTKEQKQEAMDYVASVRENCRLCWSRWQRIRYRWIECLYL